MACGGNTPSAAITGKGSTIAVGGKITEDVSTTTFVSVGEVATIERTGLTTGEADITNLQSPGGINEYLATSTDPGSWDLTGNYIGQTNAGQAKLRNVSYPDPLTCRVERYWWRVTFFLADASTEQWTFPGFMKTYKGPGAISPNAKVDFSASIRQTGIETVVSTAAVPPETTTLSAAMTNSATTVPLTAALTGLAIGDFLLVDFEQMEVTSVATPTAPVVTRGANSTAAAAHSSGATVTLMP
jgi:hypothetical protein